MIQEIPMRLKIALACAWACIQVSGWAQSTATEPDGQAWRRANAAVGQHQRGHADILAQEAAQTQKVQLLEQQAQQQQELR